MDTVDALRSEISSLRAQLKYLQARHNHWHGVGLQTCRDTFDHNCSNGLARRAWAALPNRTRYEFAGRGDALVLLDGVRPGHLEERAVAAPEPQTPAAGVTITQTGGGKPMNNLLRFDGARPIWSDALLAKGLSILARNLSLSPLDYPHAAEDLTLACRAFGAAHLHDPLVGGGGGGVSVPEANHRSRVAVFSSISPWIELTLLQRCASTPRGWAWGPITTIDFNPPVIADGHRHRLKSMAPSELASEHAAASFDLVISFSGIEHDGLGRYGEPIHPDGDLAAMRELWLSLAPRGRLLLGLPTCYRDVLFFPWHRVYGPRRLRRMLVGFTLLGRVWDGALTRGTWAQVERGQPPALFPRGSCWWQHQQVLVLQREDTWPE